MRGYYAKYNRFREAEAIMRQMRPVRSREETAQLLGCTQQNVRLIEMRALTKLVKRLRERVQFEI